MTTIACKGRCMAADTQITGDGVRLGVAPKIAHGDAFLVAATGKTPLCQAFIRWALGGRKGEPPDLDEGDGLIMERPGHFRLYNAIGCVDLEAEIYAMGSGGDFALAAMAAGCSAREAVEVAIRFDTNSGGEVTELMLPDGGAG